jgi:amino acid transporter
VLGVSQVAALQNVLTATKLAVIAAFLLIGFAIGNGDWVHFSQCMLV